MVHFIWTISYGMVHMNDGPVDGSRLPEFVLVFECSTKSDEVLTLATAANNRFRYWVLYTVLRNVIVLISYRVRDEKWYLLRIVRNQSFIPLSTSKSCMFLPNRESRKNLRTTLNNIRYDLFDLSSVPLIWL